MSSPRPVTLVFYALTVTGVILSTLLAVREAGHQLPIVVESVSHERVGDRLEIEARVTNTTGERRCPEIRAVARDRNDRDLAEAAAWPDGADAVDPGESALYRAEIMELTEEQHTEELADVRAYAITSSTC